MAIIWQLWNGKSYVPMNEEDSREATRKWSLVSALDDPLRMPASEIPAYLGGAVPDPDTVSGAFERKLAQVLRRATPVRLSMNLAPVKMRNFARLIMRDKFQLHRDGFHPYRDIEGNPASLFQLCQRDPEWAASRIRWLEERMAASDAARAKAGAGTDE